MSKLFSDDNFQIESWDFSGRLDGPIILSFSNYLSNNYNSKAFSEDFCRRRKINFISVKSRHNYWYHNLNQYYLDKIRECVTHLGGSDNLMITGSSMGGTAALVYGKALHAKKVLAYSPQFSIECKFEHRYRKEIGKFEHNYSTGDSDLYCSKIKYCVVYDKYDPDFLHYLEYKKVLSGENFLSLNVPFSGHPSAALLRDIGLLSRFVERFLYEGEIISLSRARKKSLIYFANFTQLLFKRKKYKTAFDVAQKVINNSHLFRVNDGALFDLGTVLIRVMIKLGLYADAEYKIAELIQKFPKKSIGYLLAIDLAAVQNSDVNKFDSILSNALSNNLDLSFFDSRVMVYKNLNIAVEKIKLK